MVFDVPSIVVLMAENYSIPNSERFIIQCPSLYQKHCIVVLERKD